MLVAIASINAVSSCREELEANNRTRLSFILEGAWAKVIQDQIIRPGRSQMLTSKHVLADRSPGR